MQNHVLTQRYVLISKERQQISMISFSYAVFDNISQKILYLEGKIMILLLLFGSQCVPPLTQYFTDGTVVLVGVPLVNQRTVPLAKDHKCVHWPSDVVLFSLCGLGEKRVRDFRVNLYNTFNRR